MSVAILKARIQTLTQDIDHIDDPELLNKEGARIVQALEALPLDERVALRSDMETLIAALQTQIQTLEQRLKDKQT
jgi:uncharacterized small protein (DUF1192 family)